MSDPSYPPGVRDANLEDDQHAALPDSDFREAEERDIRLEEKVEQRELDAQRCTCGEPHTSRRIEHHYDGQPCYVKP